MGTYTPNKIALPNSLDELGFDFGMQRLPNETLHNFRKRLLDESEVPAGASQQEFIRSVNRQVGLLDENVFEIDLILDAESIPLAEDPYIEITSTHIRAYSNFASGILDFEHSLIDRDDAYFLRDIKAAFDGSSYFDLEVLDPSYTYKYSRNLRIGNTNQVVLAERLKSSRSNKLNNKYIKTVHAQSSQLFQNEVASKALLLEPGDYYIDYTNGVIFTEDIPSGFVSYTYSIFPFLMAWQEVRAYPMNDIDIKYAHYDTMINEQGEADYLVLNSEGASIINKILSIHSLGWGD